MSVLAERFAMGDIVDVEKYVRKALHDYLGPRAATLSHSNYEDALGHGFEVLVKLFRSWDPDRKPSFSAYAGPLLRRRFTDFYRAWLGDNRYGATVKERNGVWAVLGVVPGQKRKQLVGGYSTEREATTAARDWAAKIRQADPLTETHNELADNDDPLREALSEINADDLSPESAKTLRLILRPMVFEGETLEACAARLCCSRREITRRLNRLRAELAGLRVAV